jgi:hypothetical protein
MIKRALLHPSPIAHPPAYRRGIIPIVRHRSQSLEVNLLRLRQSRGLQCIQPAHIASFLFRLPAELK